MLGETISMGIVSGLPWDVVSAHQVLQTALPIISFFQKSMLSQKCDSLNYQHGSCTGEAARNAESQELSGFSGPTVNKFLD